MEQPKGVTGMLELVLNKPVSSLAIMGLVGILGISTGFISYNSESQPLNSSQTLDTAVPGVKGKGFKNNKYDNATLKAVENAAEDSIALANLTKEDKKGDMTGSYSEKKAKTSDQGFASNEDLPLEEMERSNKWNDRHQVRSHYSGQMNNQMKANRHAIEDVTASAALSPEELAERKQREEAIERASRMEQLAENQLQMLQKQKPGSPESGAMNPPTTGDSGYRGSQSQQPATVTLANLDDYVEMPSTFHPTNTFYGLNGKRKMPETIAVKPIPNAIEAVVHGDADNVTLVTGSTIKLRLLQDIQIGKFLLPRNSLLTGECAISGERVQVFITTVRVHNSIMPIKMRVYDVDGHPGIYVPNLAVKNQVAQSSSQAVTGGGLQMPYMVPTGGNVGEMVVAQTASQGVSMAINGVRSLTSKKIGVVKVTVRPNHRVFLKQDQN